MKNQFWDGLASCLDHTSTEVCIRYLNGEFEKQYKYDFQFLSCHKNAGHHAMQQDQVFLSKQ